MIKFQMRLSEFKGIGPKKYERLKELGLRTVQDALTCYPRSYIDKSKRKTFREALDQERVTLRLKVMAKSAYLKNGKKILKVNVVDENMDKGTLVFFNADYLATKLKEESWFLFYGEVAKQGPVVSLFHPDFCSEQESARFERIEPVYPLVAGITSKDIGGIVETALISLPFEETLPEPLRLRNGLVDYETAIRNIHFPENEAMLQMAEKRLVFEEFFEFQLGLYLLKGKYESVPGIPFTEGDAEIAEFCRKLPFFLTQGQEGVLAQIFQDMRSEKRMNRLLQGDVGSGKTIVSLICAYRAFLNGYQTMILAPTEILAEQHFESFTKSFEGRDIKISLLTGSTKAKDKAFITEQLKNNEIHILIGTHALLEDPIEFGKIGLIVTDEQHRFGVRQRNIANSKGSNPDVLVMSATPIPRTLSLILYGDMDISILREMPHGRKVVKTHYVKPEKVADMYGFLRNEVAHQKQVYMVCPLIEDSEFVDLNSATKIYEDLKGKVFRDLRLELLHGKLTSREKEDVMRRFKEGSIDILVATTVIEVGVNVPNATIMVIYNTERFGLSQLHQLRGRVGRGKDQSYCFLLSDSPGKVAKQRIETMTKTNDGFEIAEKDLEIRGPGELMGNRQHGIPEFKIANLLKHSDLLHLAQAEARRVLEEAETKSDMAFIKRASIKIFDGFSI